MRLIQQSLNREGSIDMYSFDSRTHPLTRGLVVGYLGFMLYYLHLNHFNVVVKSIITSSHHRGIQSIGQHKLHFIGVAPTGPADTYMHLL